MRTGLEANSQREVPIVSDDENDNNNNGQQSGSGIGRWVIFILIYGVGNLILYSTTGILLIPIPRK